MTGCFSKSCQHPLPRFPNGQLHWPSPHLCVHQWDTDPVIGKQESTLSTQDVHLLGSRREGWGSDHRVLSQAQALMVQPLAVWSWAAPLTSLCLSLLIYQKGTRISRAHSREEVGREPGARGHGGLWNAVGQNPTISRQVLGRPASLLFVGNFVQPRAQPSPLCNSPICVGKLTFNRLWSRTGSRIRPPIHAFIDRLANHTQGTQNVLCGKLSFSKCLRSAGVIKPAGWS